MACETQKEARDAAYAAMLEAFDGEDAATDAVVAAQAQIVSATQALSEAQTAKEDADAALPVAVGAADDAVEAYKQADADYLDCLRDGDDDVVIPDPPGDGEPVIEALRRRRASRAF